MTKTLNEAQPAPAIDATRPPAAVARNSVQRADIDQALDELERQEQLRRRFDDRLKELTERARFDLD